MQAGAIERPVGGHFVRRSDFELATTQAGVIMEHSVGGHFEGVGQQTVFKKSNISILLSHNVRMPLIGQYISRLIEQGVGRDFEPGRTYSGVRVWHVRPLRVVGS